jgi:hypothetical protein
MSPVLAHQADIKLRPLFGRFGLESGHHRLVMSISAFDPNRTSTACALICVRRDNRIPPGVLVCPDLLWQLDSCLSHDLGPIFGLGVHQFAEL